MYLIAVQTPAYSLGATRFAIESAFASHLVALRSEVGDAASSGLILVAPEMEVNEYVEQCQHLTEIDSEQTGIGFLPAFNPSSSGFGFWFKALPVLVRRLWLLMPNTVVVHSGMAFDIRRPVLAVVNAVALARRRPTLFIVDIDFRRDANRYRSLGVWSLPKYLANVVVLNPFRCAQVWAAVRTSSLVLLKGDAFVTDFGRGRPHVKNFRDTVHSEEQVLGSEALAQRLHRIRDRNRPLVLCYFGRLVWKKGVDRIIDAVWLARAKGCEVRLEIIGAGDMHDTLIAKVDSLSLGPFVRFHRQVQYGQELFDLLDSVDMCVAAPLVEDTPRAAFDAFARGLPILAFDTEYFCDLATASEAVSLCSWPSVAGLANEIGALCAERERIAQMSENAVGFAKDNTQRIWLQRRHDWTQRFVLDKHRRPLADGSSASPATLE